MLTLEGMTPESPSDVAAETTIEGPPEGSIPTRATVLVVDDDLDIAEACEELLASAGYGVRIAHGGRDALASLSEGTLPDCVLLDVDMPGVSGPEMAHQMLLHDAGEECIPILLVSGRIDLPDIAARVGTPYFLAKASAGYADALLAILARAVRERRAPGNA